MTRPFISPLLAIIVCSWVAGCATPQASPTISPRSDDPPSSSNELTKQLSRREEGPTRSNATPPAEPGTEISLSTPDAVIKVDPATGGLAEEMERRLAKVAKAINSEDGILVRLEGYVPSGGSPAIDLVRAERIVQVVRERLQHLGVSRHRIVCASFGSEHDEETEPRRPWVEVFLLRRDSGS